MFLSSRRVQSYAQLFEIRPRSLLAGSGSRILALQATAVLRGPAVGASWSISAPRPRGAFSLESSSAGTVPLLLGHRAGSFDSMARLAPHHGDLDETSDGSCRERVLQRCTVKTDRSPFYSVRI